MKKTKKSQIFTLVNPTLIWSIWVLVFLVFNGIAKLPPSSFNRSEWHPLSVGASSNIPTQKAKLNINQATYQELIQVRGIGPVFAGRIMKYRETFGEIRSAENLDQIKGFGSKKLKQIRDQISF
ncbi:MAG: helix-hairpin-helix domain-containing protein [Candidatus Caenarcaniphilales bacterium]|nr:helix-hairpin-helix domain-containing protein [Candidatus Caenarcaniphilales bacterium]